MHHRIESSIHHSFPASFLAFWCGKLAGGGGGGGGGLRKKLLFLVPHSPGTPSSSALRMVNAGCYGCRKGRVGGGDTVKVLVSLCQPESLLNKDSIPAVR